jgi:hypothetical protein
LDAAASSIALDGYAEVGMRVFKGALAAAVSLVFANAVSTSVANLSLAQTNDSASAGTSIAAQQGVEAQVESAVPKFKFDPRAAGIPRSDFHTFADDNAQWLRKTSQMAMSGITLCRSAGAEYEPWDEKMPCDQEASAPADAPQPAPVRGPTPSRPAPRFCSSCAAASTPGAPRRAMASTWPRHFLWLSETR